MQLQKNGRELSSEKIELGCREDRNGYKTLRTNCHGLISRKLKAKMNQVFIINKNNGRKKEEEDYHHGS
jgi:hypothetical protein